jgi:hypothetical protein
MKQRLKGYKNIAKGIRRSSGGFRKSGSGLDFQSAEAWCAHLQVHALAVLVWPCRAEPGPEFVARSLRASPWERNFAKSLLGFDHLSDKQQSCLGNVRQ